MLYHLLRGMARAALRLYYGNVRVREPAQIPNDRPVMLVANHPNALVDAMLVATTVERKVLITARATLFESRLLSMFLRRAGVIPLLRAQDIPTGDTTSMLLTRNSHSRTHVIDELRRHSAVLIFPEGTSHDRPYVAPLKSGAARLALQAHESKIHNLQIVPIGLIYEAKDQLNTDVFVRFGTPIDVDAWCLDRPTRSPAALTQEIGRRLSHASLDLPAPERALYAKAFAGALAASQSLSGLMHATAQDSSDISDDAIEGTAQSLRLASAAVLGRIEHFVDEVNTLTGQLQSHALAIDGHLAPIEPTHALSYLARDVAFVLLLLPLALLGRAFTTLLLHVARYVALRSLRNDESRDQAAMRTILIALASLPLWCGLLVVIFAPHVGALSALLLIMMVLGAILVHACYHTRLTMAGRRVVPCFRRDAPAAFPADLLSWARALRDEARALEAELQPTDRARR
jgi:glycerol-3-phosphate O-acyltransferase/dihydroxyacetone phosphate acyltransferase